MIVSHFLSQALLSSSRPESVCTGPSIDTHRRDCSCEAAPSGFLESHKSMGEHLSSATTEDNDAQQVTDRKSASTLRHSLDLGRS